MKMSCNGCRVLRKGCSDDCIIKPCLEWISSPEAQGHATLFLAKFYGRTGLLNLLANATNQNAQAVFKSLLYEAAGRLVNPTHGALGLFWIGQWSRCEAAVESVLTGSNIDVTAVDGQTSSGTLVAGNHVLPTTFDIRHVASGTNVDIKEKTQFKRAGSTFKPKPRVGWADNATLLKSVLENGNLKTAEALSMVDKELNGATETQLNLELNLGQCEAAIESVLNGSNINDVTTVDGQTSSGTLIAENHVLPTTSDIRHVARGTNVDIKGKTQFKRAGPTFKPKSRVSWADNAILLKSVLENSSMKTAEASSMVEKELNGAAENQVNLELTLGFNCQSSNDKKII